MLSLAINLSQILRRNKKLSSPRKTKACSRYCRDRLGVRPGVKILLKNLRSSFESLRTNGEAVEIMGDFSVHAERVEAFLGFFSIITIITILGWVLDDGTCSQGSSNRKQI